MIQIKIYFKFEIRERRRFIDLIQRLLKNFIIFFANFEVESLSEDLIFIDISILSFSVAKKIALTSIISPNEVCAEKFKTFIAES